MAMSDTSWVIRHKKYVCRPRLCGLGYMHFRCGATMGIRHTHVCMVHVNTGTVLQGLSWYPNPNPDVRTLFSKSARSTATCMQPGGTAPANKFTRSVVLYGLRSTSRSSAFTMTLVTLSRTANRQALPQHLPLRVPDPVPPMVARRNTLPSARTGSPSRGPASPQNCRVYIFVGTCRGVTKPKP